MPPSSDDEYVQSSDDDDRRHNRNPSTNIGAGSEARPSRSQHGRSGLRGGGGSSGGGGSAANRVGGGRGFEVSRTWEALEEGVDGTISGAVEGLLEGGKRKRYVSKSVQSAAFSILSFLRRCHSLMGNKIAEKGRRDGVL